MEAESYRPPRDREAPAIDWESFYGNYRKPGYVAGFEIVNKLGGGVFGIVFKARKESIGKDYAIKFLKVDDEAVRDAVLRELESVRFFAQVDHPNLVSIEDKGEVDGIPYILMGYAGEETLRRRLDSGRMDRTEGLRVFCQAARGVQALHEHSLVHFDLKPANIFLKGDIARVGDYGLSKLVTESRNSLSFGRGTPYYMAPEMLKRRGDARSDVYSLGVILFECLTGDVPFRGDSEWEVLKKHETAVPQIPPGVGERERRVLLRALAKDPDHRYQAVAEMLHDLQAPASLGESLTIPIEVPRNPNRARVDTTGGGNPRPASAAPGATLSPPPLPADARSAHTRKTTARPATGSTEATRSRGPIGWAFHAIFRAFELVVLAILVPLRVISVTIGRVIVFLLRLPLRIISFAFAVLGYLVVALMILLMVFGAVSLIA